MGGLIPLGDSSRKPLRRTIITMLLILLNVFAFVCELKYGDAFVYTYSAIPAQITHGQALLTLLTSMFMHGGWMHIIGNMIYLWAFGPEMEDAMGRFRFLAFYLVGGIVAMTVQVLASPASIVPNLGASGAIAAVMGAFLVIFPTDRIRTALWFLFFVRVTYIPAILLIGFWFLMQLFNAGQVANTAQQGGVAYLAHVGGFVFGVITGRLWKRAA
ncbi:MAG: rhomboid family intramembrane serine protease [Acidobacteriota bacterium]|nr:rhomboid family intramembrane serine protease [Acidobacteriota bacterium]